MLPEPLSALPDRVGEAMPICCEGSQMNAMPMPSAGLSTGAPMLHANAIRWLSEVPVLVAHAVEALSERGEEIGAKIMIDLAIKRLSRIKEAVDDPKAPYVLAEPDQRFLSEGAPEGFDTIAGWLAKNDPGLLESLYDPMEDIQQDHAELRLWTREGGQEPARVPASVAVAASGRPIDWAYPVEHLIRRYIHNL